MIEPKDNIVKLALQRVLALGQEASNIHHECVIWRETSLNDKQLSELNEKFASVLEDQHKWIGAIMYALRQKQS